MGIQSVITFLQSLATRRWVRDIVLRKLLKNIGIILSGDGLARLLGFGSLVLTARDLGAATFGLLVLAHTYAATVNALFNFQSWQAIIKYGAEALGEGRQDDFRGMVRLGTILDLTGAILAFALGITSVNLVGNWLGWSHQTIQMAGFCCLTVLFNLSGTPIGVIRLLDRFDLFAIQRIITDALKLIAIVAAYLSHATLWTYVLIWTATEILGYLLLQSMAYIILHRSRNFGWWRSRITEWRPFVSFMCWTNLSQTMDIPVKQLDVFIISTVVSIEAVGVYKVFKNVGDVLMKPVDPIRQAVYPQFAAMIAAGEDFQAWKMAGKLSLVIVAIAVPIVVLMAMSSQWWLRLFFGPSYAAEWVILNIFVAFQLISVAAIAIHPLFLSMGYVKSNFVILAVANLMFLLLAYCFGLQYGLLGVVLALGAQKLAAVVPKLVYIRKRAIASRSRSRARPSGG